MNTNESSHRLAKPLLSSPLQERVLVGLEGCYGDEKRCEDSSKIVTRVGGGLA